MIEPLCTASFKAAQSENFIFDESKTFGVWPTAALHKNCRSLFAWTTAEGSEAGRRCCTRTTAQGPSTRDSTGGTESTSARSAKLTAGIRQPATMRRAPSSASRISSDRIMHSSISRSVRCCACRSFSFNPSRASFAERRDASASASCRSLTSRWTNAANSAASVRRSAPDVAPAVMKSRARLSVSSYASRVFDSLTKIASDERATMTQATDTAAFSPSSTTMVRRAASSVKRDDFTVIPPSTSLARADSPDSRHGSVNASVRSVHETVPTTRPSWIICTGSPASSGSSPSAN